MHKSARISLNAVRIFTVVARESSITIAAAKLGVTASAVSHQIKNLELDLGTPLFIRGNNSLALTGDGQRFYEGTSSAVTMIERSAEELVRDANEIVVRVGVSLAVRWLIPALERFKAKNPGAKVRVETSHLADVPLGQSADIAITYQRFGEFDDRGEMLLRDFSRPVMSPNLLKTVDYNGREDIGNIPAIKCTEDNWDWHLWADRMGIAKSDIKISNEFDTDDAALHAAAAGLGMVLSPALISRTEIDTGRLVSLPGFEPTEVGRYSMLLGSRRDGIVRRFRNWLMEEAKINQPEI